MYVCVYIWKWSVPPNPRLHYTDWWITNRALLFHCFTVFIFCCLIVALVIVSLPAQFWKPILKSDLQLSNTLILPSCWISSPEGGQVEFFWLEQEKETLRVQLHASQHLQVLLWLPSVRGVHTLNPGLTPRAAKTLVCEADDGQEAAVCWNGTAIIRQANGIWEPNGTKSFVITFSGFIFLVRKKQLLLQQRL